MKLTVDGPLSFPDFSWHFLLLFLILLSLVILEKLTYSWYIWQNFWKGWQPVLHKTRRGFATSKIRLQTKFTVHGSRSICGGGGQNLRKAERRMSKMRTVVHKKCIENVIFVHLNDKNMSENAETNKKHCKRIKWIRKGEQLPFQS